MNISIIKFYWNTTLFIQLYFMYGWFLAKMAELSSCNKNHIAYKTYCIYLLPLVFWPLSQVLSPSFLEFFVSSSRAILSLSLNSSWPDSDSCCHLPPSLLLHLWFLLSPILILSPRFPLFPPQTLPTNSSSELVKTCPFKIKLSEDPEARPLISFCFVLLCFLELHLGHMEVPGLGGQMDATDASPCHSHSNVGSELHLQPILQLTAMTDL